MKAQLVENRCHFWSLVCLRFVFDDAADAADVELIRGADAAIGVLVTWGFVSVTDVDIEETTAGSAISGEEVEVEVGTNVCMKLVFHKIPLILASTFNTAK